MRRSENIESQEEKESGSVKIKLKRHLLIKFLQLKGMGDNFMVIAIVVWLCQQI